MPVFILSSYLVINIMTETLNGKIKDKTVFKLQYINTIL